MTRAASFAGVILAAGESSRMGRDKALLPWPPPISGKAISNDTFLSAAILSLLPVTEYVVVVVGTNEAALAPIIYASGASLVVNPDPSRGQFSSLQVGLQDVLNHGRDAAMVTLVDRPPIGNATIQILRDAFEAASPNIWATVPEFSGKHGHPYLVGREMMEAFLRVPATSIARDIEHQLQEHIEYVKVDDPLVALNVNTPEDYKALSAPDNADC
ncbi:MAG TPA: nucleotidyltransferase family protein [Candidatus Eremiobacteraceae bacterium]|nr:nucleotidyltransferase family protein [Candidatus Eremiobacteraceae bacterium]